MKTAAEWVRELWGCMTVRTIEHRVTAIQAEAYLAGAEAQRESDARVFEPDGEHQWAHPENFIRKNPLVVLDNQPKP